MLRLLRRLVLALLAVAIAAAACAWLLLRASLPQLDGEYHAEGAPGTVTTS